jgi:hypothetical protein
MSKLEHWSRPAPLSDLRALQAEIRGLPRDIGALVEVVQGLLVHAHWRERYGVPIDPARERELQFRRADHTLARALELEPSPLSEARPPAQRVLGVCRHFSVVLAAFLRAQGRPARARCGFADYFDPQRWVDHWVCEVWDDIAGAWRSVDAQLDVVQRSALKLDFDPLDVPRQRFVVAGEIWQRCRAGELDPQRCGIFELNGLWFVAANVVRDLAAFEKCEMLPWDVWGPMFKPHERPGPETLVLLDHAAQATLDPDGSAAGEFYAAHEAFRVPGKVTAAFPELKVVDVSGDVRG